MEGGDIQKDELAQVIKDRIGISFSEKDIHRLMKDVDQDDDDQIDYEEFVALMTKSCMQRKILSPSAIPRRMMSNPEKKRRQNIWRNSK